MLHPYPYRACGCWFGGGLFGSKAFGYWFGEGGNGGRRVSALRARGRAVILTAVQSLRLRVRRGA